MINLSYEIKGYTVSNNSVEASIELIEHYATAARSSLEQHRDQQPVVTPYTQSPRVATAYEAARTQQPQETLEELRARAARIARTEQRGSSSQPNILKRDQEHKDLVTKLALAGSAILFATGLYLGASEVVEKLNDGVGVDDISNVMDTSEQ